MSSKLIESVFYKFDSAIRAAIPQRHRTVRSSTCTSRSHLGFDELPELDQLLRLIKVVHFSANT